LSRLTPGFNTNGRTTKEEILQRAGYQERTDTASFNFLAEGKNRTKTYVTLRVFLMLLKKTVWLNQKVY
jgi:hypothetical protein